MNDPENMEMLNELKVILCHHRIFSLLQWSLL